MSTDRRIIPRSEWGAKRRDGFGTRPIGDCENWLHHSVTTHLGPDATFEEECAEMRKLEEIGESRFKGGISYTTVTFPSGRIYQGHSFHRIGAHTQGHNTVGCGHAIAGNYQTRKMTAQQEASIAWLMNKGVRDRVWKRPRLNGGHRDTKATACPGNAAYPRIPAINTQAAGGSSAAPSTPKPAGKRVLTYGSTGKSVGELQEFLKACGLYAGKIDESFGPDTLTGLKAYQEAVGLSPDGSCGPATWGKITAGAKPPAKPAPKPPAPPAATGGTYTVKKGDSLSVIAQRHGTTTATLAKLNGIKDANKINVGQKIKLPVGTKPAPAPAKQYYTVKRGDSLSVIAQRHKTTTAALVKLNGIKNPNLIRVGQRLRIK